MTRGPGRINGKSTVITGAAFGIGRATAELFAREGARLVLTDIQADPLAALAAELQATEPRSRLLSATSRWRTMLGG
jgi:NAD(P)-dependent dehydrogenase (short-subunit alcohol dehydrogenase family)